MWQRHQGHAAWNRVEQVPDLSLFRALLSLHLRLATRGAGLENAVFGALLQNDLQGQK